MQESKEKLSILRIGRDLFKNEGLRVFWKGNTAGILLYASYNSVQFSVYDYLQRRHLEFGSFVSGGTSALIATSLTYPFDLLRTRMSISKDGNNLVNEFKMIVRGPEGFKGLFKGYALSVGQVVPYMGCIFAVHRLLSNHLNDFWAGASSGFICKTAFMPADVIRRRLQLFQTRPEQFTLPATQLAYTQRSSSRLELLKEMWRVEGFRAFFRGWSMAVLKSTPATAITFAVHKAVKSFLNREPQK